MKRASKIAGFLLVSLLFFSPSATWGAKEIRIGVIYPLTGTSLNPLAARYMGIPTEKMNALAWGIGCGSVSVAGALIVNFWSVNPFVGLLFTMLAFSIVALGGFGSVPGAFFAGIVVGLITEIPGIWGGDTWRNDKKEENSTMVQPLLKIEGIVYVPEERMLFAPLSVEENIRLGAYVLSDRERVERNLTFVYTLFPHLARRREQAASTLSGGEQQMVAIARGLMSGPRLLMLDEPSLGLAPVLVEGVLDTVRQLQEQGISILLVEQNVREALDIADRGYLLRTGRIVARGRSEELLESDMFRSAFLGI